MKSSLRLEFDLEMDHGELFAVASNGSFSGASSAWFTSVELADFGRMLAETYPLQKDKPIVLEGGTFTHKGAPLEVDLGLKAYPIGSRGSIGLHVQLVAGTSAVSFEVRTDYEELRRFGHSICALADGSAKSAELVRTYE